MLALAGCAGSEADVAEPSIELVEVVRIDPGGDPSAAPFGRISDLEIGADGAIYVLDALGRNVRVFDANGEEVASFGQQGRGPGELESPDALFWGLDGNLWVADRSNGRLTEFTATGELVATYRNSGPILMPPPAIGFTPEGRLRAIAADLPGGSLELMRIVLAEYEVTEGEVLPVQMWELAFVEEPELYEYRDDEVVSIVAVPLSGEPVFRIAPSGAVWYVQTREPTVHRWTVASGLDRSFGRRLEANPLSQRERHAALDEHLSADDRALFGPAGLAQIEAMMPETKPYLRGVFLEADARIWVMRNESSPPDDPLATLDVYDTGGELLGMARARMEPQPAPRVRDGRVAAVVTDELGAEAVVVYEIAP